MSKNIKSYPEERVDLTFKHQGDTWFIEAKILSSQTIAAKAYGQIEYYNFRDTGKNKLALLFNKKPNQTTMQFLESKNITVFWEENNIFNSNNFQQD